MQQEGRWPAALAVQLRFVGGGADSSRYYIRSTAFPAPSLATVPAPALATGAGGGALPQTPQQVEGAAVKSPGAVKQLLPGAAQHAVKAFGSRGAAGGSGGSIGGGCGCGGSGSQLAEHIASGQAVGAAPETALEAALLANAEAQCRAASALQPPAAKLVEVRTLQAATSLRL